MKDRFKFRAWDTKDNVMHYDVQEIYFGALLQDKDCVVMQCTGLKDRNGNLIYEGDVVLIKDINNDISKKCIVEFDYCAFWAKNNNLSSILYSDFCEYEIIGNIYENKELLEERK